MNALSGLLAFVVVIAAGASLFWRGRRLIAFGTLVAGLVALGSVEEHRIKTDPEYAVQKEAAKWKTEVTSASNTAPEPSPAPAKSTETEIPRSVPGDKGRYYLIEAKREGDIIRTLHKRVGVDSVGWTRCEINCSTMLMREIGYSESGPDAIKPNPTKWFELVRGSSKSDLVDFVCRK